jgi:hypothetical protein
MRWDPWLRSARNCIFRPARDCRPVSGILRIVKGDKGTAGTMVAPAGEFKPRTSAKVRLEFAMNIYTKPAAPASETATDSTAPQAQSWRDTLPIHPAAELFPLMSEAQVAALGKNIREHGLKLPISVWSDGKSPVQLLDGRNRLDAIEIEIGPAIVGPPSIMAGKDFHAVNKVDVLDPSVDPYAFVISANIHRRHLTVEQKRDLIAKLIKATPEKSDRQIAEIVKASPTTVGTKRAEMEATGDVSKLDTRTDTRGSRQPVHKGRAAAPQVRLIERALAAKTAVAARDDIGPNSAGKIARLNARIDELQIEKRELEIKAVHLRSEIRKLKAAAESAPKARTTSELLPTLLQLDMSISTGEIDAIGATLKSDARARLSEVARTLLAILAAGEEA